MKKLDIKTALLGIIAAQTLSIVTAKRTVENIEKTVVSSVPIHGELTALESHTADLQALADAIDAPANAEETPVKKDDAPIDDPALAGADTSGSGTVDSRPPEIPLETQDAPVDEKPLAGKKKV